MVGEFPELQGIMGGYYARHDGEANEVAIAIEDHYRPRFAGDALPRNVGHAVALADKLETLAGLFGIGQVPTGDKDPFALRRHALGVVRMLIEKDLPLDAGPALIVDASRWAVRPQAQPRPEQLTTSSTTACAGACCASRATARRKSRPCWPCARSAWATCQAAGRRARLRRAARGAGAGRGQQAHRQHPEEGREGRSATSTTAC